MDGALDRLAAAEDKWSRHLPGETSPPRRIAAPEAGPEAHAVASTSPGGAEPPP